MSQQEVRNKKPVKNDETHAETHTQRKRNLRQANPKLKGTTRGKPKGNTDIREFLKPSVTPKLKTPIENVSREQK